MGASDRSDDDLDALWDTASTTTRRRRVTGAEDDRIRRSKRGDRRAADALLDRHLVSTWNLAMVMVGHGKAAATGTLSAWQAVLASRPRDFRRALIDAIHDAGLRRHKAGTSSRVAGARDRSGVLRGFLVLPEAQRTAWWLLKVEGLPLGEVAQIMGRGPVVTRQALQDIEVAVRAAMLHEQRGRAAKRCQRAVARFAGYLDGSLTPRDEALLHAHVEGCAMCTARLDALEDPAGALLQLLPPVPDGVRAQVLDLVFIEGGLDGQQRD